MAEFRVGFEAISHKSVEDLSEAFYREHDGVLTERGGKISVFVYVEATTAMAAALNVLPRLELLGFSISRVDQDLVDGPEIASRLEVSRQAVQLWAKGTRGSGFPHPIGVPGGKRIWTWGQITEWAARGQRLNESKALTLDEAAQIDALLVQRRLSVASQTVRVDFALAGGFGKRHAGLVSVEDYPDRRLRSVGR